MDLRDNLSSPGENKHNQKPMGEYETRYYYGTGDETEYPKKNR